MSDTKKLILIDGSSFLFRAYFAARQGLSTKDGMPTGAILIVTRMIRNLVRDFAGHKIIAVFDAKGPSFRGDMYKEYKATRPPMPDDLRVQIEPVHNMVKAMGIPLISVPGVEADDVLGSYALEGEKQGYQVIICTSDKDLAQLVNENINLLDTAKNVTYDSAMVVEKYGVPPSLIIDLLALKGDSADNIPGMKGVGDKTAAVLLNALGNIENIKANLDLVAQVKFRGSNTFKERFLEQLPMIELSYKLATIKTDVPLPIAIDDVALPKDDHATLIKLFERFEFNKFAEEQRERMKHDPEANVAAIEAQIAQDDVELSVQGAHDDADAAAAAPLLAALETEDSAPANDEVKKDLPKDVTAFNSSFKVVLDEQGLKALAYDLSKSKFFTFNVFHNEKRPTDATLVGISFSLSEQQSYYLPFKHMYLTAPEQISLEKALEILGPIFSDPKIAKSAYDFKLQRLYLSFAGFDVQGGVADPMIVSHIIDSSRKIEFIDLVKSYLSYSPIDLNSLNDKGKTALANIDIERFKDYACEQALMSYRLGNALKEKLSAFERGDELCAFEMQVLDVLFEMEKEGAFVNAQELNNQATVLKQQLVEVEQEIFELAGTNFNVSSPKQLGRVLFETLAIPYPRKNVKNDKEGKAVYSTADDILSELVDEHPIAQKVQRYRMLSKLISNYVDKLPAQISKRTGRIHTVYNLAGTVTGRLSSSDPNLQNIPARTPEGRQIRCAFQAPEGFKVVSADYSQIELRLIAHFAQDPNLIKAFQNHQDIHRTTAAEVLGKRMEDVTDNERAHAKATNFGLMYGMAAMGLSRQTGMSSKEAKLYIEKYFMRYPTIKKLMEKIIAEAKELGYIKTVLGFHVVIPGIKSTGVAQRAAERAAINAPMQGSAADIIKKAMIEVQSYIKTLPEDAVHLTLQVHDELIFEVREDLVESFTSRIKEIMEGVVSLSVPLEVGIGIGNSWDDAH